MANLVHDQPAPPPEQASMVTETHPAVETAVPTKRKLAIYWTPKPSDIPALSVLVDLSAPRNPPLDSHPRVRV